MVSNTVKNNILFVDDEENILKSLKRALFDEKYNCFIANNANAGIEIIKNNDIDLVISDMRMPDVDGLAFLKEVEKISPDTVKIILSGQTDMSKLIDVVNSINIFNFMLKPWDVDKTLKPLIKKALKQAKLIKTNKLMGEQIANQLRELEIKHFKLQKLTESLEDSDSIIMSIANAVEAKDSITNGHVNRVSYLADKIGRNLGLSSEGLDLLRKGSILHDIGKLGIPDNILNKPGKLTNEEFDIMKTHTIIGEKIISTLKTFQNVKSMIRHHHEKLDGSGYPDNLKAPQIDIYTRIIAIVDIYDALTDNRPYRNAMSQEQAFSILRADAAKGLIDSNILDILITEVSKNE